MSKLETTQPAAFAELYKKGYSLKTFEVKDDGSIPGVFDPNIDFKGLTWGAATYASAAVTGASISVADVWLQDIVACWKYPYVRELPQAFFDLMAADLDGPVAEDYRGYIRHEVKPALDRIKDILNAHYAAIEAPPVDWLIETFPGHSKGDFPSNIPGSTVAYARAWDRVLAGWDAGRLDVLYPPSHMMPWSALSKFNTWSRQRGEAKQEELIGMSSGKKDSSADAIANLQMQE